MQLHPVSRFVCLGNSSGITITHRFPATPAARRCLTHPHVPITRHRAQGKGGRRPQTQLKLSGCLHSLTSPQVTPGFQKDSHLCLIPREHTGVDRAQGQVWQDKVEDFRSKDLAERENKGVSSVGSTPTSAQRTIYSKLRKVMSRLNTSQVGSFPRAEHPRTPCALIHTASSQAGADLPWLSRVGGGLPGLMAGMPRLFLACSGFCAVARPAVPYRL